MNVLCSVKRDICFFFASLVCGLLSDLIFIEISLIELSSTLLKNLIMLKQHSQGVKYGGIGGSETP